MRKEYYRVKRPGYVVFGNSADYGKRDHSGSIVDYNPASCFSAGVILSENCTGHTPICSMSICFAREDLLCRIMREDSLSEWVCDIATFPQTRRLLLEIDGEWDEIRNDCSESCCRFQKLFHLTKHGKFCVGAILSIRMPDNMDFSTMQQMARNYFQNMKLTSIMENGCGVKAEMGLCFA